MVLQMMVNDCILPNNGMKVKEVNKIQRCVGGKEKRKKERESERINEAWFQINN